MKGMDTISSTHFHYKQDYFMPGIGRVIEPAAVESVSFPAKITQSCYDVALRCQSSTATSGRNKSYRKISNIRRTKFQNLKVSRLSLQLSLHNILKPSVKWRMKMSLEQR